jgi:NAD(P)-dependent dehydrogenase (short-subunit alcohol dehydrogenase family)
MRLADKVALITGAGAGIGRACAELFAREGARVVIAECDEARGMAARDAILALGHPCTFVATDVSDPDSMHDAIGTAVRVYGRIDILYNNAGGSTLADGPVTEAPYEEFWRKMKVDLFGTWLGCRFAIPHMRASGGGSIINAGSMCGLIGTAGRDAYTAAKGAIAALTRSMAVEFAPDNIRVNAIAAGVTATERVRERLEAGGNSAQIAKSCLLGVIDPTDIAHAVLYLASDEARRTTGHVLVVDSGLTIS